MRKHQLLIFALCVLFIKCRNSGDQEITFKPVKEFNFTPGTLPAGTTLDLIAFSGGKANTKDKVYYYQFIGVDPANGDTIRILSTLISVPDETDAAKKIYTPTSQYDFAKRIVSAIFYPQDSTHDVSINLISETIDNENKEMDLDNIKSALENKRLKNEFVVVNKSIDIFANEYKTVFGVLHFTERPW